jgi:hypothetical protein
LLWSGPDISTSRAMFTGPSDPGKRLAVTRHGRPNICGSGSVVHRDGADLAHAPPVTSMRMVPSESSSYVIAESGCCGGARRWSASIRGAVDPILTARHGGGSRLLIVTSAIIRELAVTLVWLSARWLPWEEQLGHRVGRELRWYRGRARGHPPRGTCGYVRIASSIERRPKWASRTFEELRRNLDRPFVVL